MPEPNDEPVYIDSLEIENTKRIKAVKIECKGNPITIIGGGNLQGKTSILDTIAFILGGERFRPSNLHRDDALSYPAMKANLSNGLVAERKGKNSALKVTDPEGKDGGQTLLNKFVSVFALDLPRFLNAKPAEKADMMLQIYGVAEQVKALEDKETKLYNERLTYGRIADQKQKHADELPTYPDAPEEIITATELLQEHQAILMKNAENQRLREKADALQLEQAAAGNEVDRLEKALAEAKIHQRKVVDDYSIAKKTAEQLKDESTEEIKAKIDEIDALNVQARANMDKENANQEAEEHKVKYDEMTEEIQKVRDEKKTLLDGVDLPLPGLSVEKGELTYNGKAWDCMGSSEQLCVGTAIVRKLNPKCGFVLIDKLEALDLESLQGFIQWLKKEGIRPITTRVSKGDECSIIIEDGFSIEEGQKTFLAGEF